MKKTAFQDKAGLAILSVWPHSSDYTDLNPKPDK